MAYPDLSNPDSLGALTAMLNQTLIETGRFFRSGGSLQSRAQLKRAIPAAHEQFQCALDNLSEQIFVAKAFLERDYESVQARKAALRNHATEDVTMGASEDTAGFDPAPVLGQAAVAAVSGESESKPMDNEIKVEQQTEMNKDQRDIADVPVKEEEPQKSSAAPRLPAQGAAGAEEINFDSLLNDEGPNEFDLNLDFGGDGNTGNENFFNSNYGDANAGTGFEPGNAQSSVPESGQPTGGDAFDLELQKLSAQTGEPNEQFGGNTDDIMGPGESSFDDLFMESENMGGNDGGEQDLLGGDGLMQINELDDSWFT